MSCDKVRQTVIDLYRYYGHTPTVDEQIKGVVYYNKHKCEDKLDNYIRKHLGIAKGS